MGLEAILEPVGPLPPGTYWRRRGGVIVLAIVFLFLVSKACGGGGGAKPTGTGAVAPTPTPGAAAAATTPAAPAGAGACADTQLALTLKVSATRYPSGAPPQFTFTVTNTGPQPCTRDLSPAAFGLVVRTGTTRAWSSTDCQAPTPQMVTLKVNDPQTKQVAWNRRLSDEACKTPAAGQPLAATGTYVVTGVVGSLTKQGPSFSLAS